MLAQRHAFLSGWDALFILIGLHFSEALIGSWFDQLGQRWGLDESEVSVFTLLAASAVVFTLAMKFTRTGWRELFHGGTAAPQSMLLVLVPVLALVPALSLALSSLMDQLVAIAPLSRWEEELFATMASDSVASLLLACVLAPLLEEMLFRGLILRGFLARYGRWQAILASALLFGAAHVNIYQFMVAFLIGLPLGWLYERTRSLIPCIALHAAYNTSVTWLWTQDAVGTTGAWWDGSVLAWSLAIALGTTASLLLLHMLRPARIAFHGSAPNEEGPCRS